MDPYLWYRRGVNVFTDTTSSTTAIFSVDGRLSVHPVDQRLMIGLHTHALFQHLRGADDAARMWVVAAARRCAFVSRCPCHPAVVSSFCVRSVGSVAGLSDTITLSCDRFLRNLEAYCTDATLHSHTCRAAFALWRHRRTHVELLCRAGRAGRDSLLENDTVRCRDVCVSLSSPLLQCLDVAAVNPVCMCVCVR
jgi:hypothetical protein